MCYKGWLAGLFAAVLPFQTVYAHSATEGIQSFGQAENAWKRPNQEEDTLQPNSRFVDEVGAVAMTNIFEAEQVFCYEVFPQDNEYKG